MEYRLTINEATIPVRVEGHDDKNLKITINERSYRVRCVKNSEHSMYLEIDGKNSVASVFDDASGKTVVIDGIPYSIKDADRSEQGKKGKRGEKNIPKEITPPMPAVVARILVSPGDAITKGQGVIVVSAMKMETTLAAPFDGTVTAIHVGIGDKVMPGQVLADIEKGEGKDE